MECDSHATWIQVGKQPKTNGKEFSILFWEGWSQKAQEEIDGSGEVHSPEPGECVKEGRH